MGARFSLFIYTCQQNQVETLNIVWIKTSNVSKTKSMGLSLRAPGCVVLLTSDCFSDVVFTSSPYLTTFWFLSVCLPGLQNPHPLDCPWSHPVPQVHLLQWCLELWHCHVGGDVLRWEALLGHVQSGCKFWKWWGFTSASLSCISSNRRNPHTPSDCSFVFYFPSCDKALFFFSCR